MKVMQINVIYKTGSTGLIVKDINNLLITNKHESFVGYGRGNHKDINSIKIGDKYDMFIHGLGTRLLDRHGLFSKKATIEFIYEVNNLNIDIFHLHNIHGYYLHYPTLFEYFYKTNKPVIWTLHDCWSYTGHCSYYDYVGCKRWQTICNNCLQKNTYPASILFDNSKNNFLLKKKYFTMLDNITIVTPSHWLKNEVKKSFLRKYAVHVIPNGIDIDVFKPIKSDFRERKNIKNKFMILGVASQWQPRKGFECFIALSKSLHVDEVIVLVGLAKKQLLRLPENIIGIIKTENIKELSEIYSAADVFLNPTLEDNFPTTNIESLACGTPVITFNTGGSVESLNRDCGLIVEKGNLIELNNAIQIIKTNKKVKYSNDCRNRAVSDLNKNKNFMSYIELYNHVLS